MYKFSVWQAKDHDGNNIGTYTTKVQADNVIAEYVADRTPGTTYNAKVTEIKVESTEYGE